LFAHFIGVENAEILGKSFE
jgi:hypothetical protein